MAMARTRPMNRLLLISRQYTVAAGSENVRAQPKAATEPERLKPEVERPENVFWMRDPATGNWAPESQFGKICVAELREKLLSKKQNLC